MADDQKPKTMDINDLVRELSKSSTSPVPALTPLSQAPRPFFPTPKPPTPSPMTGLTPVSPGSKPSVPAAPPVPKPLEMPKPQFNVPPKPFSQPPIQSKPIPVPVAPTPGVKEYQSSIRTMNEDIGKLKQGQKPVGIEIPRKIEQVVPVPQVVLPKPAVPSQQFKIPSINLGEAKRVGPLAQSKDLPKPPVTPKVEPKSQIYIPPEGARGVNRNILFIGIGAVAIIAGLSYWFFVLRSPVPEVVIESPTPSLIETPVQDLKAIFAGISDFLDNDTPIAISVGEFKRTNSIPTQGIKSRFLEVIEGSSGSKYPVSLGSALGQDGIWLLYGQKEVFDQNGQIKIDSEIEFRTVLIGEIDNPTLATQYVKEWENTITDDLKFFITTDKSIGYKGPKVNEFLDNNYRGTTIRYKNFPYPDKSIDYAFVQAANGKSYLVITSSREAMYATIDKLKGF